jgi:hypothetical protein
MTAFRPLNCRFAMENLRSAVALRDNLKPDSSMKKEVDAIDRLIKSLLELPRDMNSLPSEAIVAVFMSSSQGFHFHC